ncbi:hypothetical protein DERF_000282 [Dermatophagoides farinae]|uniref:RING-CH-type domain-containing protein n=1 Tax=Dermatophagoides farinae TaxID=6954 RepID=A0A922LCD2_DERFA|nr:hypothetical protein DERF_000282 [Dermatophagoides farinae]
MSTRIFNNNNNNNNDDDNDTIKNNNQCRICYSDQDEIDNKLISPCHCTGTIKYIHYVCLVNCIIANNRFVCDICQCQPNGIKVRFVQRSFWEFIRSNIDICNEFFIILIWFLLIQIFLFVNYKDFDGTNSINTQQMNQQQQQQHDNHNYESDIRYWHHLFIQFSFMILYTLYVCTIYQKWIKQNLRIQIVQNQ